MLKTDEIHLDEYPKALLLSFLERLKTLNDTESIWINYDDLERAKYRPIKAALFEKGQLFDCLGIETARIRPVHEHQWNIVDQECETLKALEAGTHILSPAFQYVLDSGVTLTYHFRCYAKYSQASHQCAFFVVFDEFPESVKRMRVEMDIQCHKKKKYGHLLKTQTLTEQDRVAGFQAFAYEELERNESIVWRIGMKMINAKQYSEDESLYRTIAISM